MKKAPLLFISLTIIWALVTNCKGTKRQAKIQFDKDTIRFSISQGKVLKTVFRLRNIGDGDLNILSVGGDCNCTSIEYPKNAISAGKSAEIKVTYNSGSDEGEVKKIIVVKSNTDPILHTLTLKGMITKIMNF